MVCEEELLVQKVCDLYEQISNLESLKPSNHVDMLFTDLVMTCMPQIPHFNVKKLSKNVQEIRSKLIRLCGEAEGLLESHFSDLLATFEAPLDHLSLFPYYSNYLKLSLLEHTILRRHLHRAPAAVAFIGSGPLPLSSIVLALNHLPTTSFHNYDVNPVANSKAFNLVSLHSDLSKRMVFHNSDVLSVADDEMKQYEVVFLAALVGMNKEEKVKVVDHLAKTMANGAYLLLRSAHGARAFLYPVAEPEDLVGFEILSVYHPTDEVINSVILARKTMDSFSVTPLILPNKCSEIQAFSHGNMIEEIAMEEHS